MMGSMADLFSSPGMIAALVIVLVLEVLSLLTLFLCVQVFRSQSEKYRLLLEGLEGRNGWGTPGRILLPLYILTILGSTVVTILIFMYQPHWL